MLQRHERIRKRAAKESDQASKKLKITDKTRMKILDLPHEIRDKVDLQC